MVFSEISFVFFFLPIAFLGIFPFLKTKIGPVAILLFSFAFFYWGSGAYTLILALSILLNFGFGLLIQRWRHNLVLVLCIFLNLGILFFYKYFGFFLSIFGYFGDPATESFAKSIILPIGISFYTFQGVSYVVDVWRKDMKAENNPLVFGAYLSFFPQLIAGPIVRYQDIRDDFANPDVSVDNVLAGLCRFSVGLFKKVVIADTVAAVADAAFQSQGIGELSPLAAWIGALAYTLQIYFDFSAYSDMALGIARMFGLKIKENFNHPYASASLTEFWRRWHISLSTWFRDYLYIPLGGNRLGSARTYFNLTIVFLATGIWHGASWNFLIWGMWHGLFLIFERAVFGKDAGTLKSVWLRAFYFFPAVIFGWVLFRSENLQLALDYMLQMVDFTDMPIFAMTPEVGIELTKFDLTILLIGVGAMLLQGFYRPLGSWVADFATRQPGQGALPMRATVFRIVFSLSLLVIASVFAMSHTFSPFLYFRF